MQPFYVYIFLSSSEELKIAVKIRKANLGDFNRIDLLSEELLGSSVGDREEVFRKALENKKITCVWLLKYLKSLR